MNEIVSSLQALDARDLQRLSPRERQALKASLLHALAHAADEENERLEFQRRASDVWQKKPLAA